MNGVGTALWSGVTASAIPPESSLPQEVIDSVVEQREFTQLSNWIAAGIVLAIGIVVAYVTRRLIVRMAARADSVTSTVQVVSQLMFGLIIAISIAIALSTVGVDLTPLLAGAGIIGLTVGFALKDVAENYVSGVIMGFSNPFAPGDQIIVDDGRLEGAVEELQLRYTVIRSTDGVRILMPNSMVLKNPVENLTANGERRSHFTLGVAFGTDLDAARRLAVETVAGVAGVHADPAPEAFVEELAASWVTIRVRFWHGPRNHDRWDVRGRAITAAFEAFTEAGIDMPFRHRVLEIEGLGGHPRREVDDRSGDGSERQ